MDEQCCLVGCRIRRTWLADAEEQFTEVTDFSVFHIGVNELLQVPCGQVCYCRLRVIDCYAVAFLFQ